MNIYGLFKSYIFHEKYNFIATSSQVVYNGLSDSVVFSDGFKFDMAIAKGVLLNLFLRFDFFYYSRLIAVLPGNNRSFIQGVMMKISSQDVVSFSETLYFMETVFRKMILDLLRYKQSSFLARLFIYGPFFQISTLRYFAYKRFIDSFFNIGFEKFAFFSKHVIHFKYRFWQSFFFFFIRFSLYRRKLPDKRGFYRFMIRILRFLTNRRYRFLFRLSRLRSSKFLFSKSLVK